MCHIKPLVHSIRAGEKFFKKALLIILDFLLATAWPLHSRGIEHSEGYPMVEFQRGNS